MMSRTLVLFSVLAGCARVPTQIDIPEYMKATPKKALVQVKRNTKAKPAPGGDVEAYALRIVDQGRSYEVSLPPVRGGYEVRVPLDSSRRRSDPKPDADPYVDLPQDSLRYKEKLIGVRSLFAQSSFDLAAFELTKLLQLYPDDPQLLAMQGSVEWKLGNEERARELWQRVLDLDPTNVSVLQMLEGLP